MFARFFSSRSLENARDSVPPSMKKPKSGSYAPKPTLKERSEYFVSVRGAAESPFSTVSGSRSGRRL